MPKKPTGEEVLIEKNSSLPKGKNTMKTLGIFFGIIIILIALGVGIYSFVEHGDQSQEVALQGSLELTDKSTKIPYTTKVLTVTLDAPIENNSVNSETVTLSPIVDGDVSISPDNKIISYTLRKPLEIGESYDLTIASTLIGSGSGSITKDKVVTFEAIATPAVSKIFPTGSLDALSQNITVVFNTPMVPLTNLDERDTLPCPLVITPKVEGRCVWTTTSILEYIPTRPLEGATRYTLQVQDIGGLLHGLSSTFSGEILTTPLQVRFTKDFSPSDGIILSTTSPVAIEDLLSSLELSQSIQNGTGGLNENIDVTISSLKNGEDILSETRFLVVPKNQNYTYNTSYQLKIKGTLKPKYGTEPLGKEIISHLHTSNFLRSIEAFQNISDTSGTVVDTKNYGGNNGTTIPNKAIFFLAYFDRDIGLDKSLILLRSQDTITPVDFDLTYIKENEYDTSGNIVKMYDNKTGLKITPKGTLKANTFYEVIILKKADSAMLRDEVHTFRTASAFTISDFKLLSNTEGCVYTSNKLLSSYENGGENGSRIITTTPLSKAPTLKFDYGVNLWNQDGSTYTIKYTCPQIPGKNAYILDLRLDPLIPYKINFLSNIQDEYGQPLSQMVSFSTKTGPTAERDRYLYSSAEGRTTQVIPSNLPIVLGLLSVNTDVANIEVCEMSEAEYVGLLEKQRRGYYAAEPDCTKKVEKRVQMKNKNWTITPTKIDIEKEILGKSFSSQYIYIKGYLDRMDTNLPQYFSHTFIRSNLALTLEDGANSRVVFASSYDGKSIPPNLSFEGYSLVSLNDQWGTTEYKKIPKIAISWNPTKQIYTLSGSTENIKILIAKNASYFGVINLDQDQTSNYDFKYISGQDASSRDYLYIYPDRPLYKPSDTVYFKGVLRSYHFDGYHPSKIKQGKLKIIGGQGTVSGETSIAEMDVSVDENSNIHGEFILPKSAPLGRYSFEFYASGSEDSTGYPTYIYNNGEFFIEAYKKPVFKVTGEAKKSDVMIGESTDIKYHAEYYFGGALSRANYQYSVMAQSYYFDAKNYRDYSFSNGSSYSDCLYWGVCQYSDELRASGTGILDDSGDTILSYKYVPGEETGEKIYTYSLEATDPDTEKTVNYAVSQIVHATDGYVGIRSSYWNSPKTGVKVNGVVLDYNAKGMSDTTVGLELIKREWKNVKKEGVDGVFYNEGSIEETKVDSKIIKSDGVGEFNHTFIPTTGGEYEIRASYTGSNGIGFTSSTYTYIADEDTDYYWYEGNNSVADITPDKTILSVGDTAGFTLKTPIQSGKMLISIEKDDGILDSYTKDITDTTMRIELPVLDSYIPNVYVKVFAIGQNPGEKLPIYKRALSVVKVLPDPKKLSVTVTADKKKYLPGESVKLTVQVKDSTGKGVAGANGTLSIVDQSLLALAGNPQKNPFAYFYDMKRYLGVMTYTSLLNLVQKLEVKDTSLGEKGGAGDGQKGGLSKKKRGVFKDTAFWQADFITDKNGVYTLTTQALPDNLTIWVIEALINTKKSEVGVGMAEIQTSKNVLINDNLPRFLGTSDSLEIAPVIFNKTDNDAIFDISIEASHLSIEKPSQSVAIKAGTQVAIPFRVVVDGIDKIRTVSPQASKILIKAISRATGDSDTLELIVPIIETTTRETTVTSGRSLSKQEEIIELRSAIRANGGSLDIRYAGTLLPGLLSGLDFLKNFPYGCIEQKLAAVMPQVYLKKLHDSIGKPYDLSTIMVPRYVSKEGGYEEISINDTISDIMGSLPSYQKYDGGFGYWAEGYSFNSDLRLTLSIVSRLRDLSDIGFMTSAGMKSQVSQYIKKIFYANRRPYCIEFCSYNRTERLDMIRGVLDINPEDYEGYKMYQIVSGDTKNDSPISEYDTEGLLSHAHLLLRLSQIKELNDKDKGGLIDQANSIAKVVAKENIVINPRGAFIGRSTSASRLTNTLGFVELITLLRDKSIKENEVFLDQMGRWIISQKQSDGSWGSTLDTMSVVRSITAMERATGDIRNINLSSILSLDGTILEKQTINNTNNLATFSKSLTLDMLQDSSIIRFENSGTGKIYYDIALEYALRASTIKSRDEGFYLNSEYYDYAEYQIIDRAKTEEWKKYIDGKIEYAELKYPKDTVEYLKPLTSLKVGELVLAYNRMITSEPRDQVAFEGFIPAGSELVNPNLKTESQDVRKESDTTDSLFSHEEWQDDRYFATINQLDPGIYTFKYILRPTHVGIYELRPSRIGQFYQSEIFGRTAGKSISIIK